MKRTSTATQRIRRRLRKLDRAILKAYAFMAMSSDCGADEYFAPINELRDELAWMAANADTEQVFAHRSIYAFVCAANEHAFGVSAVMQPDANMCDLYWSIYHLDEALWPCPGHTRFWDWVAELRRRPVYWNNGAENRSAFQLNPWEWIINWDELDWKPGFDIVEFIDDELDNPLTVVGYLADDGAPVYIEHKYGLWIAGRVGNRSWRDGVEVLLSGWRNPFAATWFLQRRKAEEVQGASAP